MNLAKAPLAALLLATVALAGCSGDGEALGIEFTEAADPVTQPFQFKATGSADRFVWDFNDGTGTHEGKQIDHTFGFTDGKVTVRLTAHNGEETESVSQQITLGTGQNQDPVPFLVASTNWVGVGDTVTISAASTTDADGDPILFRWNCGFIGLPGLPHDGSIQENAGLPFGVQAVASLDANLTSAERTVSGDLCDGLSDPGFTRDGSVQGAMTEVGVYNIDVDIRDPKSQEYRARLVLFVTDPAPPAPTKTETLSGTLFIGSGGAVQGIWDQTLGDQVDFTFDKIVKSFQMDLPNEAGTTITFTGGGPLSDLDVDDVKFVLHKGGSSVKILEGKLSDGSEFGLEPGMLNQPGTYVVEFTLEGGINVAFDWQIDVVYDMNPLYKWDPPA